MNNILKYFFGGLIALIPIFILYQAMKSISILVRGFFPEMGILITFIISLFIIVFLGFLISKGTGSFFKRAVLRKSKKEGPLAFLFEFFSNFKIFSEKTKSAFKNPVYFEVSDGIFKLGFVTNEDIEFLITEDRKEAKVAVYAPEPVSFIGELLFIEKRLIRKIDKNDKENIPIFLYTAGIIKKMK
jgi:uncharacterized membrane protein